MRLAWEIRVGVVCDDVRAISPRDPVGADHTVRATNEDVSRSGSSSACLSLEHDK